MQLTPVESSHVAAIGYLEAERVLLVRYTDGSLYARTNFPKDMWIALAHAKSKGSFLAQPWPGKETQPVVFMGRVGGAHPEQHNEQRAHMQDAERVPLNAQSTEMPVVDCRDPLNVIDEDAALCCRRSLAKSLKQFPATTIMSCGDCGQEFEQAMVGPNKLWRCKPAVAIVRPRR